MIVFVPMTEKSASLLGAMIAFPFVFAAIWYRKAGREEEAVRERQRLEEIEVQKRFACAPKETK